MMNLVYFDNINFNVKALLFLIELTNLPSVLFQNLFFQFNCITFYEGHKNNISVKIDATIQN